jgi:predicted DCC family thiol-disulfide oxidoreductase YuxK
VTLTVLYDEGCGFCTTLAARLARHGRDLVVEPIGSPAGDRFLADLGQEERYAAVHVVDPDGRRQSGGAAVPPVLARLPGGRLPAAFAARLPRLTDAGYELVARNRATLSRLTRLGQKRS